MEGGIGFIVLETFAPALILFRLILLKYGFKFHRP